MYVIGVYSIRMDRTEQRYVMKFLLWMGENTRQFTPNLTEFSRDISSRLMFANIVVESSKLAIFDG
jgi:hypothetical protein